MELMEAIKKRQSIRDYEDRPVPEDKLRNVLEAARLAPSASNRQRWKFVVVRESERRRKLYRATGGQTHIANAPVVIAATATMPEYVMRSGVPAHLVDLAIAVDHMTLAAVEQELGTCWIGGFDQEDVKDILKIPENYRVVALLTLGFPRATGKAKIRKPLEEIVCYETFEE
ncbi:nitroreductase family protein [Chloroflexota bacterium]